MPRSRYNRPYARTGDHNKSTGQEGSFGAVVSVLYVPVLLVFRLQHALNETASVSGGLLPHNSGVLRTWR